MDENNAVLMVADNVYRIGPSARQPGSLDPNIYLVVSGEEAALVNTGPYQTFDELMDAASSLIAPEKIVLVALTTAAADMCSALPLVEKKSPGAHVAMHWRTSRMVSERISSLPPFIVNENRWEFSFRNGKKLLFFPSAYLSSPGEIQVFEPESSVLFSSSLFSSFTSGTGELAFDYRQMEPLIAYHEHYMPDSRTIKSILEKIRRLPVKYIAPSYGGIISDHIPQILSTAENIQSGSFREMKRKNIGDEKKYFQLCTEVLRRWSQIYPPGETEKLLSETGVEIDKNTWGIKSDKPAGPVLWEMIFVLALEKKGISWLSMAESLVRRISKKYSLSFPAAYNSVVLNLKSKNIALDENIERVQETRKRIREELEETEEKLTTCPVTGLRNEYFFRAYMEKEFVSSSDMEVNGALLMISLDDIVGINSRHGRDGGDDALRGITYLVKNYIAESELRSAHFVFKLNGPVFAYFIPECNDRCALTVAEELRSRIASSSVFVEDITVSTGIVDFYELYQNNLQGEEIPGNILRLGISRIQKARESGGNTICDKGSAIENNITLKLPVLIIEPDSNYAELLASRLMEKGIHSGIISDGNEAVEFIRGKIPSIIVSEIMVPGVNGFAIKEGLLTDSSLSSIPFILTSHKKNDDYINRAISLNINYYFRKPYSVLELTGIIENILSRKQE